MKFQLGHISHKALLFLVAFLVSVPCSVKREIKQAFNVPVSNVEHSEKPNKTVVCQVTVKETVQTASADRLKKDLKKQHFGVFTTAVSTDKRKSTPVAQRTRHSSVPIYILHEQYLI